MSFCCYQMSTQKYSGQLIHSLDRLNRVVSSYVMGFSFFFLFFSKLHFKRYQGDPINNLPTLPYRTKLLVWGYNLLRISTWQKHLFFFIFFGKTISCRFYWLTCIMLTLPEGTLFCHQSKRHFSLITSASGCMFFQPPTDRSFYSAQTL